MDIADRAVAIDDDGVGNDLAVIAPARQQSGAARRIGHQHRIVDFQRPLDVGELAGLVDADADDLQPLFPVLALELDQILDFILTGRAPARPEIEDDDLTLPLVERVPFAVQPFELERLELPGIVGFFRQRYRRRLFLVGDLTRSRVAAIAGPGDGRHDGNGDGNGGNSQQFHFSAFTTFQTTLYFSPRLLT